jgi:hypothetical protein
MRQGGGSVLSLPLVFGRSGVGGYDARRMCRGRAAHPNCRRATVILSHASFFPSSRESKGTVSAISAAMEDHYEHPGKSTKQMATHTPQSQIDGGTCRVSTK